MLLKCGEYFFLQAEERMKSGLFLFIDEECDVRYQKVGCRRYFRSGPSCLHSSLSSWRESVNYGADWQSLFFSQELKGLRFNLDRKKKTLTEFDTSKEQLQGLWFHLFRKVNDFRPGESFRGLLMHKVAFLSLFNVFPESPLHVKRRG